MGTGVNLTIFDSNDPEGGSNPLPIGIPITFYANFTNSSGGPANTTSGACNVSFDDTGSFGPAIDTVYNATSQMHQYSRYFNNSGNYAFNMTCSGNSEIISAVDTFNVSLICGSVLRVNTNLTESLSNTPGYDYCLKLAENNIALNGYGFSLIGNKSTNSYGITSQGSSTNTTIENISISEWEDGIGGATGITLIDSQILSSIVTNVTDTGIRISSTSTGNNISNNQIENVSEKGMILVAGSSNNMIFKNTFQNTVTGLFIGDGTVSSNNTIKNNTFINNSLGIDISSTATNNRIFHNIFKISSAFHAGDASGTNYWNTSIGGVGQGNFWDDVFTLDIRDANGDGWGDIGTQYPYNVSNGGHVTQTVQDNAPQTILCGDIIDTDHIIGTLPRSLSQNAGGTCLTVTATNVTIDCASFSITGSGLGIGISVVNTTDVTIRNCVISTFQTGIKVDNVTQFTALNDTLLNHTIAGILLTTSNTDSLITQSTIKDNIGNGIYLYNEKRDTLSHNIIQNNSNGTFISLSQNITLVNNTILLNRQAGILNNASDRTNITQNNITQNGISTTSASQIQFESFQRSVTITHNTIKSSPNASGIISDIATPRQGTDFTIMNNTINNNGKNGILLDIENSTITQNFIQFNGQFNSASNGLGTVGDNNIITHNTITNNTVGGISVIENNNTVQNNTVINSTQNGVLIKGDNNRITQNTIKNNGDIGLQILQISGSDSSVSNRITNNTILDNKFGIVLEPGVINNVFGNNTITNNTDTQVNITDSSTQNNTFRNNTITGVITSVGVNISAGSGNAFALNTFSGSAVLAHDQTILGTNSWNDSSSGDSGGGNNWGDITSLSIFDNTHDGFGETGSALPFNETNSASLSNVVLGNVSDNRPITNRTSTTVDPGCRGCGDPKEPEVPGQPVIPEKLEQPIIPEKPKEEVPKKLPDDQIACLSMNGNILQKLISENVALPKGVNIPDGYKIIKGPFQLACNGENIDITFSLPDNYQNLKMMRCIGVYCYEITSSSTDYMNLKCGNSTIHKRIESTLKERQDKTVDITGTVSPKDKIKETVVVSEEEKTISHGTTTVELTGWTPSFMRLSIYLPEHLILEPQNPSLKIVGLPKVISMEKAVRGEIPARILFAYLEKEFIEEESIHLFYYKKGAWNILEGRLDMDKNILDVTVDDLNALAENDEILLAPIGVRCVACKESIFKKEYEYEHTRFKQVYDYGGGRNAYILIHGLLSSSDTFEYIINDFQYNKQPGQVWTLEYTTSRPLDLIAQDFIDEIEEHLDEYDTIYIVGHSLGAFVVQRGLEIAQEIRNQDKLKYRFLDKVKKIVLIAAPNEGTPGVEVYKNLFNSLVNEKTETNLFNIDGEVLKRLSEGINTKMLPNIEYNVMAGSETYEFNLGLFKVKSEEILQLKGENDGITTIKSAQHVGDTYINDTCNNFYEINLTHTELVTNPLSIKVLERILTKEIAEKLPDESILGYNQYFKVGIPQCSAEEYYVIIGQQIGEDATFDPLLCKCGNGICGIGEDALNCPKDCAYPTALPGICVIMPITINMFAIIVILLFIAYLVKKYLVEYHKKKVGNKLEYITYGMLFLLALTTFWTRFVCKKSVPYAYLILIIGILYILFVELWDKPNQESKRTGKIDQDLYRLQNAIHRKHRLEIQRREKLLKKGSSSMQHLSTIDKMLKERRKEEEHYFLRGLFPKKKKKIRKIRHPELEEINKEIRENKKM